MSNSITVRAAACNMAALITWKISGGAVKGAQGLRITRISADGTRKVLRSPTPFPGETGSTQPSDVWPSQKKGRYFDFEPPLGDYTYEVALMVGTPKNLQPSTTLVATSNKVSVTTKLSDWIMACFNWGILSTQEVSRWIEEHCGQGTLAAYIAAEAKAAAAADAARQSHLSVSPQALLAGSAPHDFGGFHLDAFAGFHPDAFMELHNEGAAEALMNNALAASKSTGEPQTAADTLSAAAQEAFKAQLGKLSPLVQAVKTPGDPMRESLAVGIIDFLLEPMRTAKAQGGHIHDISYEVTDQQWIEALKENADLLSIILAEIGEENQPAFDALKETTAEVFARKLATKYGIAHNKIQVRSDKAGVGQEVASGAANKTSAGFCGQVTNAIRILSQALAAQYLAYYQAILADTKDGSKQGPALRQFCNKFQEPVKLPDGTTIQVIFAPNNLSATKPTTGLTPGIGYISKIIDDLEDGDVAVGNFFIPGHPSLPDLLAAAKIKKPGIVMKVAVSDKSALPAQMPPTAEGEEPVFVVAQSIKHPFANYIPEILGLPGAHAYIHSKTLVIYKARTKTWIVITGSHNEGEKADTNNDDHILVISDCTLLGLAYFVNNLSVFDHFLFRYLVNTGKAGTGYLDTEGGWQTLSDTESTELDAIMNALSSLDGAPAPSGSGSSDKGSASTPAQPVPPVGSSGDDSGPAKPPTRKKPTRRKPTTTRPTSPCPKSDSTGKTKTPRKKTTPGKADKKPSE